jgi:hypothetical protein
LRLVLAVISDRSDRNCGALPFERDTAELGDQRLSAVVPVDEDLEAGSLSLSRIDDRLVLGGHLVDGRAVFACKGLEHRGLGDPAQSFQAKHILGEQVVLDQSAVFGSVLRKPTTVR